LHLRNTAKIRSFLNHKDAETLIHAFITSHLDYCNSLFIGLSKKSRRKLQHIQNAAARVLTNTKKSDHITPLIKDYLLFYTPARALRSSAAFLLDVPHVLRKNTGEAAFCFYAPKLWNTLPLDIRTAASISIFKKKLKTYHFNLAFKL
ncbi:hypothetical protein LDENG_00091310, partial [Lucifuga dentata]